MNERQSISDLSDRLTEIYGNERIAIEPAITGSVTPDIVVYREAEQNDPYLVVEFKESLSYRRGDKAFEQLQFYLQNLDCSHGALVTPSVEYIFEWQPENDYSELSLGHFPQVSGDRPSPRPIRTMDEAKFLIERVLYSEGSKRGKDIQLSEIYQILLQKLAIERSDQNSIDLDSKRFEQLLDEIDKVLMNEYSGYEPVEYADYGATAQTAMAIFAGYKIGNLTEEVTEVFETYSPAGSSELSQHRTNPELVDALVQFADISSGMTVLDPAAGWGNVIRESISEGGEAYAVEIKQSSVNASIFLSALTNKEVNYVCSDFFDLVGESHKADQNRTLSEFNQSQDDTSDLPGPGSFERVVMDPPVGVKLSDDTISSIFGQKKSIRSEEAFIAKSLELLEPGGILVSIIPEIILSGVRTRDLRENILSEYTIESIITFEGSIYSGSNAKAGLLKIRNDTPSRGEQRIRINSIGDVSHGELDSAIKRAVDGIESGEHDWMVIDPETTRTLLPKQVIGQTKTREEILSQYGSVNQLSNIAQEVRGGSRRPTENEGHGDEVVVPYLTPGDLEDKQKELSEVQIEGEETVANQTDVLLRVKGKPLIAHRPETKVVPSSEWAIVRFSSRDEADYYLEFFQSDLAERVIDANRTGTIVPYVTVSSLREIPVPNYQQLQDGD